MADNKQTTEPAAGEADARQLRITQYKSAIGNKEDQKRTLAALGLHRLNATVVQPDSPSIRGMLYKVRHLVRVEEM